MTRAVTTGLRDRKQSDSFAAICRLGFVLVGLGCSASACAADPVQVELGKEQAWTGEAVPMIVTLFAPGPFSGAASFDLPEVPLTAITTTGNPVVGSEQVDGETFYTQRHTFHVYTQQTGVVTIPVFTIRFEWRTSVASDSILIERSSRELRFESRRPPGAAGVGVVVAAEKFEVSQSWIPEGQDFLKAGDLIQRRIEIHATATTAMMLPQAALEAPTGIRVYTGNPVVEDQTQRGESSSTRIDTVKYQFEKPGTNELPSMDYVWWDARAEELRNETISGRTVDVAGTIPNDTNADPVGAKSRSGSWAIAGTLFAGFLCWIFRSRLMRLFSHIRTGNVSAEVIASRRVFSACRAQDPAAAYSALLSWNRLSPDESGVGTLNHEIQLLADRLYGTNADQSAWNSDSLRVEFKRARYGRAHLTDHAARSALPTLNPTGGRS